MTQEKSTPVKKASKKVKKQVAPFIRLTKPQFELLKADLIAEQDSGDAPKTRIPVVEEILAGKRVKGNKLTISSKATSAVKAMLKQARGVENEKAIRLYDRMLANLLAVQ